ncbi:PREDICTED: mucin-5AC-like, partial [Dipodomys ordii]|uniref:Mucin-5AC-like n=1 Tax=Dipodomys ordii TaxID=10020 RepID=A0A1S3GWR6_DIPOR
MGTEATAHTHSLTSPGGPCRRELCEWTQWMDGSYPKPDRNSGDFDTFENLRSQGFQFCERPQQVDCRAQFFPNTPLAELGQDVTCSLEQGLICLNKNQLPPICYNYEIRVKCCRTVDQCATSMRAPTGAGPRNTSPQTPATGWTASRHSPADSSAPVPRTRNSTGRTQTRTAPVTTNCQPQCNWTKWFNVDSPVPGPHGGDVETYSRILRAGEQICSRPEEITRLQCRAESYPEASLESLGQVVLCDPDVGLLCRNQDQLGTQRKCLDYSVRVLCCQQPEGCPTTTEASIESVTPAHTTSTSSVHTVSTSSRPQTSSSSAHTVSVSSAHTVSTTSSQRHSTTSASTASTRPVSTPPPSQSSAVPPECQPQCNWTKWFNVDSPVPGPHGGDVETYSRILRAGEQICSRPEEITRLQCRAESYPEASLESLGQVVLCDPDVGLLCRNQDQLGTQRKCLDYSVRVLCCRQPEGCPTTTSATPPRASIESVTPVHTVSTSSRPQTSSSSAHTTSSSSAHTVSVSSAHTVSTTSSQRHSTTSASTASTRPVSTPPPSQSSAVPPECQPQCNWTKWFNVDSPVPGPHGGDVETYSRILRAGEQICSRPEEITRLQCRAESYPEASLESLGQVVLCDPDVGLLCRNQDQLGTQRKCLDYSVRVLCCRQPEGCPTTTSATPPRASIESVTPVHTVSTSSRPQTSSSSAHTVSTSSRTQTSSSSATSSRPQTSTSSVHTVSTSSRPQTSTSSAHTVSTSSRPQTSTSSVHTVSTSSRPQMSSSSAHTVSVSSAHTSSAVLPECQPQCNWTKWFNVDSPVPGPHGGDVETYSRILRAGEQICSRPEEITRLQCRAESYPEASLESLGQVVLCDPDVGLLCRNQDQLGTQRKCLDYSVRVLCCRQPEGCPTTTSATPPRASIESVTPVHTVSTSSRPQTSSSSAHT